MSNKFTLEFLQEKIGAEFVEINPVTGKPRIIRDLNEVWEAVDDFGGVQEVAKHYSVPEEFIWGWIDLHFVPEPYVLDVAGSADWIPEMQLSSVGYEDPDSGACWPWTWKFSRADFL